MHNVPGLKRFSVREDRTTERFSGGSSCVLGSPRVNRRIETGREGSGHRRVTVVGHNILFRRGAKMHVSSHRLSQNSAQLFLPVHQPTKRDKKIKGREELRGFRGVARSWQSCLRRKGRPAMLLFCQKNIQCCNK
uniref:Uncharacterized protein n=1 Tax=Ixodes ricinus TaxID=34613 RepID=A0A090X9S3_IXORI